MFFPLFTKYILIKNLIKHSKTTVSFSLSSLVLIKRSHNLEEAQPRKNSKTAKSSEEESNKVQILLCLPPLLAAL